MIVQVLPDSWAAMLCREGQAADMGAFADHLANHYVPNSVVVDATASEVPATRYLEWMQKGLHIITPNKKLNSGPLQQYLALRQFQRESYIHYFYEARMARLCCILPCVQHLPWECVVHWRSELMYLDQDRWGGHFHTSCFVKEGWPRMNNQFHSLSKLTALTTYIALKPLRPHAHAIVQALRDLFCWSDSHATTYVSCTHCNCVLCVPLDRIAKMVEQVLLDSHHRVSHRPFFLKWWPERAPEEISLKHHS